VLEDVARYKGLVDARVLVRLEVLQRVFRHALMLRSLCQALAHADALFSRSGPGRTFARGHVGVGDGRGQRHEGWGLIYSSVCSVLAIRGGHVWRLQLHADVTSAARDKRARPALGTRQRLICLCLVCT
jgi:hypothetical protein